MDDSSSPWFRSLAPSRCLALRRSAQLIGLSSRFRRCHLDPRNPKDQWYQFVEVGCRKEPVNPKDLDLGE